MAEQKRIADGITVNDGNGLLDDFGLIDSLIEDCNELPKDLMNGHNIRFCSRLVQMVQKLANLKQGVKTELESMQEQYADIRERYDAITTKGDDADELER